MKITNSFYLLFVLLTFNSFAQEIEIPYNLKLETNDDYVKSEKLVLKCIDWIQTSPLNEATEKRRKVSEFLTNWISGNPNISPNLDSGIVIIPDENDLNPEASFNNILSFMNGWTRYSLNHNYSNNAMNCNLAGAIEMINFYEKNKNELPFNKHIEELIQIERKGELEQFIRTKLNKSSINANDNISSYKPKLDFPGHIKLETNQDYIDQERLVLKSIDWMQYNSIYEDPEKRDRVSKFLVDWYSGNPNVNPILIPGLVEIPDENDPNPEKSYNNMLSFMNGWARYSLNHNNSKNKFKCSLAGTLEMINYYQKYKQDLGYNSHLEKLVEIENSGKIRKYIKSKL